MVKLVLIVACLYLFFGLSHTLLMGSGTTSDPVYPPSSNGTVDKHKLQRRTFPWQYYWGVNGASHQQRYNQWSAAGYVLISISVYGTPPSVEYAAVWEQRPASSWVAIHGVDSAAYQNWFNQQTALGYVSTLISATGPRKRAVYMGVMEKISVSSWVQRCDMTGADFQSSSNQAGNKRQILKSFREYGTTSDRRYCAIWHANPNFDKWEYWYSQSYADYQNTFNIQTSKPYWRPAYLSVSEDQSISSVYTDSYVGTWIAKHGLTSAEVDSMVGVETTTRSLTLINLQGGGVGDNARYTVIFAEQDIPEARTWQVEGSAIGFKDNPSASSAIGGTMKNFLQNSGVRQAQVSASKNGKQVMTFAYTWAEPSRYHTHVDDKFLLASVSKMFCAAAIQKLIDQRLLAPGTTVYALLGYPGNPPDRRLNDITVQQLIDHRGGLDSHASGFDAVFHMRDIALAQNGGSGPASVQNIVDYMFQKPLDYTPGTNSAYSNYGYVLLSHCVERVTQIAYYDYLKANVLGTAYPADLWATSPAAHTGDTIIQESALTGLSALNVLSTTPVPNIYGGDGIYKESDAGGASLAASATTLAKFITTHGMSLIHPSMNSYT